MELSLKTTALFSAIVLTGLSAGLFYAWEVSVIPGTKRISDFNYLETMQSINRAILNPAFFATFIGSLLALIWSTYLQYNSNMSGAFWMVFAAMLCYTAGTFGVTVLGNVPLNNMLDVVDLNKMDNIAISQLRTDYEPKWNRLHSLRTIFSVLAFLLVMISAFIDKNNSINL